jgi:hypothetical protein
MTRREALRMMGAGFGSVGLAGVHGLAAPHFAAQARHVIFLFLNGGLSASRCPAAIREPSGRRVA